jgi:hypothetical protein
VVSTGSLSEAKQWASAFQPTPPEICAEAIQRFLCSHDRPIIEATARAKPERVLRYYDEGHVNLLVVTIIESADNENALVAPVIEAVHSVMTRRREWTEKGSEWLEAFDYLPPLMTILEVMRELDFFLETSLGKYLGMILKNKLRKHFEPEPIAEPRVERKAKAEMVIKEASFLLKHKGKNKTSRITQLAFDKFGLSATNCAKVMNVARLYGNCVWLVKGLSRVALYELSAPSTSPAVREAIESKLRLGEKVRAPEIRRMRASAGRA